MDYNNNSNATSSTIPEEFPKLMASMVSDIRLTFPEYAPLLAKCWKEREQYAYIEDETERETVFLKAEAKCVAKLFDFCQKKYPPRFFDILYANEALFAADSELDTEFLPSIHFRNLWNDDSISETTRATIWRYLQLILFSVVGTMEDKEGFGDTAKLFEAIDQDEFRSKLEETMGQIQDMFSKEGAGGGGEGTGGEGQATPPAIDPEQMHEHLHSMLGGKIGQLAQEIASETAQEMNMDLEGHDVKEVFGKMLRNPTKLMGLVQRIGSRLDDKIKSGDIKESELIAETTELLGRMKGMPGMGDLFSGLGLGKGAKVNVNAMEAQLNQRMKLAKTKERLRAKAEASSNSKMKATVSETPAAHTKPPAMTEEELIKLFETCEKPTKTPRKNKKA